MLYSWHDGTVGDSIEQAFYLTVHIVLSVRGSTHAFPMNSLTFQPCYTPLTNLLWMSVANADDGVVHKDWFMAWVYSVTVSQEV